MSPAQGGLLKGHQRMFRAGPPPAPTARLVVPGALQGPAPAPGCSGRKKVGSVAAAPAKQRAKDAGMGQLPLGAAKMSLAAVAVGRGLGDSPLTQPGTNTRLPPSHTLACPPKACQGSE